MTFEKSKITQQNPGGNIMWFGNCGWGGCGGWGWRRWRRCGWGGCGWW